MLSKFLWLTGFMKLDQVLDTNQAKLINIYGIQVLLWGIQIKSESNKKINYPVILLIKLCKYCVIWYKTNINIIFTTKPFTHALNCNKIYRTIRKFMQNYAKLYVNRNCSNFSEGCHKVTIIFHFHFFASCLSTCRKNSIC